MLEKKHVQKHYKHLRGIFNPIEWEWVKVIKKCKSHKALGYTSLHAAVVGAMYRSNHQCANAVF